MQERRIERHARQFQHAGRGMDEAACFFHCFFQIRSTRSIAGQVSVQPSGQLTSARHILVDNQELARAEPKDRIGARGASAARAKKHDAGKVCMRQRAPEAQAQPGPSVLWPTRRSPSRTTVFTAPMARAR